MQLLKTWSKSSNNSMQTNSVKSRTHIKIPSSIALTFDLSMFVWRHADQVKKPSNEALRRDVEVFPHVLGVHRFSVIELWIRKVGFKVRSDLLPKTSTNNSKSFLHRVHRAIHDPRRLPVDLLWKNASRMSRTAQRIAPSENLMTFIWKGGGAGRPFAATPCDSMNTTSRFNAAGAAI